MSSKAGGKVAPDGELKAICGICPAGCRVLATLGPDGRLARVRADDSSPLGMVCRLGERSAEIVYSKDRLAYPMRRIGPKGTTDPAAFERITWDEAYDEITRRLVEIKAESGPEATAIYTGRGSFELAMCDLFQPAGVAVSSASSVLFPFGSPNTLGVGALCYVSFAMIAPHVTMGGMQINMFSDIEGASLVVVWGANPATDCPPLDLDRIIAARERGAEVIVIDPRRTMTAKLTEAEWVPIRPGTDGALALGLCNVIISEELFDEGFVLDWTHGFDDFARYVQHFTPEYVEDITGVPAAVVVELARRIARARGAAPVMYSGLEYSDGGVQSIRAVFTLWALAGQLDVPGGRCFTMRENRFPINREGLIPNPGAKRALGRDRFPVYSLYRGESHAISLPESVLEGRPYRIRSLIVLGGSIITSWPEPRVWRETLGSLDFLVTIDRQLTADAAYADIVLPATTMYEIDSYMTYGSAFHLRERVIEPVGEARSDFLILAGLAARLGYGHLYPQTEDELIEFALKGSGFTLADVRASGGVVQRPSVIMEYRKWEKGLLREDGRPGFETPTGRFEIASTILEEHGYDALPVYTEPGEGPRADPALAGEFPLVFNSGSRVTTDFRSQHHGVASLVAERPEPAVTINTEDARERGIEDGELVRIRTPRGAAQMRALVTDDIVRGAVDASMGGGGPVGPRAWRDCNVNELTDLGRYDPISGFPVYKALLCEVERVEAVDGAARVSIKGGEYDSAASGHAGGAARVRAAARAKARIYLDHNATTPIDPEVEEVVREHLGRSFGNPSSIYAEGRAARDAIEAARRSVAQMINSTARRVVFTSGGSESNNLAIKGAALASPGGGRHIVTTTIEHPSVINTCRALERHGFSVTFVGVDSAGLVDPDDVGRAITPNTCLVSVMYANNETGVVQPVREIAAIARSRSVIFHTDAVQATGKLAVDVEELGADLLTISGHKIYGPRGVGVLYVRKGVELDPLVSISGGSQEGGRRAGTENIAAIAGLGRAAELAVTRLAQMSRLAGLRDRLEDAVRGVAPMVRLNGDRERRLPNTLNLSLEGFRGEPVVLELDRRGVALSSGSACRSGSPEPSHALIAMGLTDEEAHCALRFSLGTGTTEEDADTVALLLAEVLAESRSMVRFAPCR